MKIREVGMKLLSKAILSSAKKEVDSACIILAYQPPMPKKVKKLSKKNG